MTEFCTKTALSRHALGSLAAKENAMMKETNPHSKLSQLRQRALSRWDNEGGALEPMATNMPEMTNTELVQLRIRVIALENTIIAVLAEGSDRQLQVAREMAEYISPRPGFMQHPLTFQAADHMVDFTERAIHFRTNKT
jgi:hypothetical protein